MTRQEITQFRAYLRNCTDAQVRGVMKKEVNASRWGYVMLVIAECHRRRLDPNG